MSFKCCARQGQGIEREDGTRMSTEAHSEEAISISLMKVK